MRILITGITGFVGRYLAEYLLKQKDVLIYGTTKNNITEKKYFGSIGVNLFECDINNKPDIKKIIAKVKPDGIFHLAGESVISTSWLNPEKVLTTNIIGELNIFESIREIKINPVVHIAGSSEEYGLVNKKDLPIRETNSLRPVSPYAVSKVAQEMLAFQYFASYGLKTICTRAFNHTGPGRNPSFVISSFAKQIADIENGVSKPCIYVGNLNVKRDFTDVRDVVRAYWLLLKYGKCGEAYNVCSGTAYHLKRILDVLLTMSKVKITVKVDKNRFRPADVPIIVGDNSLIRKQTSWKPKFPIQKTLSDILNYWRNK